MASHSGSLWRNQDFLKLWAGQTISDFGTKITILALPLTAVSILNASPVQMGLLGTAQNAPFLLVGLFAGVWADRVKRRTILITMDLGRALLLISIPVAAHFGLLTMGRLYVISFMLGVLTVFFEVSYMSYLPVLVSREQLLEGNTKLGVSRSLSSVIGPGVGGALVQLLTAPVAILFDSVSFLVSLLFTTRIRKPEPDPPAQRANIWSEIGAGLRLMLATPLLYSIVGCSTTANLFASVYQAVFVLYATRELSISAAALGGIFALSSVGGLLGALIASRVTRLLGVGPTIVASQIVAGLGVLMIGLASGPALLVIPILAVGQALWICTIIVYDINSASLRQTITPDNLLGRVSATLRCLTWGFKPLGFLLGGLLGQAIGLRPTLVVAGAGVLLASLWVLLSPMRDLREHPAPASALPSAT